MMEYVTAGESHGPQLTGILSGLPAGLKLDIEQINRDLAARQGGYGRGNRQKIEHDQVEILGGLRHNHTLGSPLALAIKNRDHSHWSEIMNPTSPADEKNTLRRVEKPRPGHADLVGGMKYGHRDLRNVLERSSARETAMKVAIGSVCQQLLGQLGIELVGYVKVIGGRDLGTAQALDVATIKQQIEANDLRILAQEQVNSIHNLTDETRRAGDTLGGVIQVVVENVPVGLGSYTSWDNKLDAKLAQAVMGINAIKGVSFGDGFDLGYQKGSQVMDQITWDEQQGWSRLSNHLGGFEGGMTNGMPLVINAVMKPIPTLYKALQTADINSKELVKANVERSDTTAIVPASIVVEKTVAIELARVILATFEGANLSRLQKAVAAYRQELGAY
ncbi:chorismate synthase [Ligilactobacillus agilis]|uniref:chorismate synthase n=1 Tax=Ligilactobacillus agilis TaxID=1601 RepID=UPI001437AED6|nr:chorismate synthase [Ligilactobacillus agilis]GET19444.1 chorismate synthase [Ligilactobacillus agilis]